MGNVSRYSESAYRYECYFVRLMQVDVESGAIMSREAAVKKIAVKSLTDKTNVPLLAGEIVEKCKLIHPSKASSGTLATSKRAAWQRATVFLA